MELILVVRFKLFAMSLAGNFFEERAIELTINNQSIDPIKFCTHFHKNVRLYLSNKQDNNNKLSGCQFQFSIKHRNVQCIRVELRMSAEFC